MSNAAIFIYGTVVTLVVALALGVLVYGIFTESKDLQAERVASEPAARESAHEQPVEQPRIPVAAAPASVHRPDFSGRAVMRAGSRVGGSPVELGVIPPEPRAA